MIDTCLAIVDTVTNGDWEARKGEYYAMFVFFGVIIAYYIYEDWRDGLIDEEDIIPTSKKPKE